MTICEFQESIEKTYGHRDRKRGLEKSFLWLVEEVGELAEAIRRPDPEALRHETGDVLAWLVSVANIAGVDIEEAVNRYASGCPYCDRQPCECEET